MFKSIKNQETLITPADTEAHNSQFDGPLGRGGLQQMERKTAIHNHWITNSY